MNARAMAFLLAILVTCPGSANQTVPPPITRATFVGTWEALFGTPDWLLHMEISEKGDSYLCYPTGVGCSCWRLLDLDIKNGVVKLHFGDRFSRGGDVLGPELRLVGIGTATDGQGEIYAQFCDKDCPDPVLPDGVFGVLEPAGSLHMRFRKGFWIRDLYTSSRTAERMIKEAAAKKP